jgi:hypothetical protein
MPLPILHADYTQIVISAFTMHNAALPPVPPLPPLLNLPGLVEGPATMGWPPGFIAHKQAPTVLVDGAPGVQQGHDVGYLIPHFALPPNGLMAVNAAFSKHKVMIPVSKVLLEKKPAGTYLFFLLGMICCNPVSLPTGVVMLLRCTVWTGFNLLDLLKALGYMALDIVLDLVWNRIFKGKWLGRNVDAAGNKIGKALLNMPKLADPKAIVVLGDLSLREMLMDGGARLVARWTLVQTANKALDHVLKSWVVSPLTTGLPRGQSGLGRGDYSVKFFDAKWW